jgi:hypothetical protein
MRMIKKSIIVVTLPALFALSGCMTDLGKVSATLSKLRAPQVTYHDPSEWACQEIKAPGRTGRIEPCTKCMALSRQTITMNGAEEIMEPGDTVTLCETAGWVAPVKKPKGTTAPKAAPPNLLEATHRRR